MQTTLRSRLLTGLSVVAGVGLAVAGEPTLKVGSPAPKLQTGKWLQGEPIGEFEPGHAYVIEFWATWCGPYRDSLAHMNELYAKFKDQGLTVIGQNCWEADDTLVSAFLRKLGNQMTFPIALDDKSAPAKAGEQPGAMAETWLAAAGLDAIPVAFLVDKQGRVAWVGHPQNLDADVIQEVLSGKFDLAKAAAAYVKANQKHWRARDAWAELRQAMRNKQWDEAWAKANATEPLLNEQERVGLDMTRFNILLCKKNYPAAYELALRLSDQHQGNPALQNELAWRIATEPSIEQRDLALAEKLATRANEAAKGKDPAILDTLARVLFLRDKKPQAIATEQKAVELAVGDMVAPLQKNLDSYKQGVLPSEK